MSIFLKLREGPIGPTKPERQIEYLPDAPVSFYVPLNYRKMREIIVRLNGLQLSRAEWHEIVPDDGSRIVVTPIAGYLSAALALLSIAVQVGTWAYQRRERIMKTRQERRAKIGDSYFFDLMSNSSEEGKQIPIVYGDHRFGGHFLQHYTSRFEEGLDQLNTLTAFGHGPIESITSLNLDGNPQSSYNNVTMIPRLGTLNDASIPGMTDVVTTTSLNTQLLSNSAVVVNGTTASDRFKLKVSQTTGLAYVNDQGSIQAATVAFSLRYRTTAGPGAWVSANVIQPNSFANLTIGHSAGATRLYVNFNPRNFIAVGDTIRINPGGSNEEDVTVTSVPTFAIGATAFYFDVGATANVHVLGEHLYVFRSTYTFTRRRTTPFALWIEGLFPSKDTYDVEITKTTANGDGTTRISDPYLKEYQEIANDDQIFPGIAKAAVMSIASEQLSGGTPRHTFKIGGRTIMNMTSATAFSAPAKSNNPADVIADYLFNADYGPNKIDRRLDLTLNTIVGGPFQVGETVLGPANDFRYKGTVISVSGTSMTVRCERGLPYTSLAGQTSLATANITSIDNAYCVDLDWLWTVSQFADEQVPDGNPITTVDLDSASGTAILYVAATTPFVDTTKATTVNADSAAAQAVLNVSDTDPFTIGAVVLINAGGAREETKIILTIQPGASLTMTTNLGFTHTSAQADTVQYVRSKVIVNYTGAREESGTILSVQAGASITLTANLTYTHTALQADEVSPAQNRHEFDYVLGGDESAHDFLERITKCCRCGMFRHGEKYYFKPLQADSPVQIITEGSINLDTLKVSHRSDGIRPNVIQGEFADKNLDYRQRIARIEAPEVQANDEDILEYTDEWFGITREAHISRELYYLLKRLRVIGKNLQFEMGIRSINFQALDIVSVGSSIIGHGYGSGHTLSSTNSTITLNRTVTLPAGTHTITVQHSDDTIETQTITSAAGTYRELSISPATWTSNPAKDDEYIVGTPGRYRVAEIHPDEDGNAQVILEEDSTAYYSDDYGVVPTFTESTLRDPNAIPDDVENLTATVVTSANADQSINHHIDVNFTIPSDPDYDHALIYKKDLTGAIQELHKAGFYSGSANGEFHYPRGICVYGNYAYVCDPINHRIQRLDILTLAYSAKFGSFGTGANQFDTPMDIDTDGSFLYIADSGNSRIIKLDIGLVGSGAGTWVTLGTVGAGANQFDNPKGICVGSSFVIVADTNNHRLVKVDDGLLGSGAGTWLAFGTQGSGNDQFERLFGIDTDGTNVYVADTGNDRIKKHLFSDLTYVDKIGSTGTGDDNFVAPMDIVVSSTTIWVADFGNNRYHRRTTALVFTEAVGSVGFLRDQFNGIQGLAVSGSYLYVVEKYSHRIQYRDSTETSNTPYEYVGRTDTSNFTINQGLAQGVSYSISVVSSSATNVHKQAIDGVLATASLAQRANVPPNVTNFLAANSNGQIRLTWDAINYPGLAGYEIRAGATWGIAAFVALIPASQTIAFVSAPPVSFSRTYHVRAKTNTDVYSSASATVTYTAPLPSLSLPSSSTWSWNFRT